MSGICNPFYDMTYNVFVNTGVQYIEIFDNTRRVPSENMKASKTFEKVRKVLNVECRRWLSRRRRMSGRVMCGCLMGVLGGVGDVRKTEIMP